MERNEVNLIVTELRKMYEEAFPEDSQKYTEYFFEKKLKKSGGGFVYKQYDNILPAMMVLVKKEIVYYSQDNDEYIEHSRPVFCIDAVTTKKEYRSKGYMDRLFNEVLFKQLNETKMPFVMLYTHIPEYYNRYGFEKAFTYYNLKKGEKNNDIELVQTGDIQLINKIYNEAIPADLKLLRNSVTLSNRLDELMNEDGKPYLIKYKGKTKGYCFLSGNDKDIDEIVYDGDYSELEGSIIADFDNVPLYNKEFGDTDKDGLMIKIVNPVEFFKMIRFKFNNVKIRFRLKRRGLGDVNLELEIKNHKASKVKVLSEKINSTIDEMDLIKALRGVELENKFLAGIEPMDIFFVERF